jgi:hypothetical protein
MPAEVKALFFDLYRQPNNTNVTTYVAEEKEPLRKWLVDNGADLEDDVVISYYWKEEEAVEKFTFSGESEDDEEGEDDEDVEIKPKRTKKVRTEVLEDVEDIDIDKIIISKDDSILEISFEEDSE